VCGRYTLTKKQLRFASRFSTEDLQLFLKERYNISPTQTVPLIHIVGEDVVTEEIRWGLQPVWSKTPIITAQCEGILKKPTFRQSVLQRRCLIPADGFYEWRGKTPFRFTFADNEPFYFAGIVDDWLSTAGATISCCCIITTVANEVVAPFHKRMPFVVGSNDCDAWLDPAATPTQLEDLLQRPSNRFQDPKPVAPLVADGEPRVTKPVQGEWTF
jgi:putative SOS response-associated peptidase YedK